MTKGANLSAFITLPFQAHELHHISPLIHTQIHLLTLPRAFSQQIVMARQERRRLGRLCKRLNGDSEPEVTHKICNKGQSFDVLFSVSFRSHKTIPKNLKKHQPQRKKIPLTHAMFLVARKCWDDHLLFHQLSAKIYLHTSGASIYTFPVRIPGDENAWNEQKGGVNILGSVGAHRKWRYRGSQHGTWRNRRMISATGRVFQVHMVLSSRLPVYKEEVDNKD